MTLGGQQAKLRPFVFQQRVGRDGGAVDDAVGLAEQGGAIETEAFGQPGQPVQHAERRVLRGRGHLRKRRHAGRIDRDQIGEGAADIDADAVHRLSSTQQPLSRIAGEGA